MNSFTVRLKRYLGNKNTVTILCVVVGLIVLFVGYNWRVRQAIDPVTVPYAKKELAARHVITADDIDMMEVNSTALKKATNVIRNRNDIIGKEVTYGNVVREGSLFYNEDLTDPELSPDYVLQDIADGYTAFSLSVQESYTYDNYITIGSYIDLWFKGEDDYGKYIFSSFVKSIRVLDVRDSKGVSLRNAGAGAPAEFLFSVPDELYSLLVKATEIGELEPAPKGASYTANPGETKVTSDYVRNFINSKSTVIPDEDVGDDNE